MTEETERRDFWSRRRQAVEAEKRAETEARDDEKAGEERQALEEKPDEEVLAELDLPDPDSLRQGDDFSAFMTKAVPERLRRRALRRLWLSNPVLANLDELVDYGEDFTDAATVVADLQSVYQVGKGMVREEDPDEAAADQAGTADTDPGPGDEAASAEPSGETESDPEEAAAASGPEGEAPEPGAEEEAPAEPRARRHMRFAFADPEEGGMRGTDE